MNLPDFKADRLDGKGEIDGCFMHTRDDDKFTIWNGKLEELIEINPETIKQKIGDEWSSMEEVEEIVARVQEADRTYPDYMQTLKEAR